MNKKRDRLEVIHDILSIIREKKNSIKPTPLLRYSNLSSQRFSEYLKELIGKGMVKEIQDKDGKRFYTLGDRGFKYLSEYKMIRNFIEDFQL